MKSQSSATMKACDWWPRDSRVDSTIRLSSGGFAYV